MKSLLTSSVKPRRSLIGPALVGAFLIASPAVAQARSPEAAASVLEVELVRSHNAELRQFYYYRSNRPLWLADGALTPAARRVMRLIETADIEGISPDQVHARELAAAVAQADAAGTRAALERAELALSRSFAAYVRLTRTATQQGMLYEHVSLEPQAPRVASALQEAARAPSLGAYVEGMDWLHPLYAPLRRALTAGGTPDAATRQLVVTNLARIRALPAVPPGGRYVLVNAAEARLWMYEGRQPVDSMRVVVGKVNRPTPMMSGYIRYAILNPYWNVPADYTRDKIAGLVLSKGTSYLRKGGYEVLSDWTPGATVVNPATVDWRAVADGSVDLRVRQLPGANNSMGKVKFEFPNQLGIYLHDTPQAELMQEAARQFSSGCVRLEDAQRLGHWLFGSGMPRADMTEQRFDLPEVVPVYITYLTVQPRQDGQLAILADPYGHDRRPEPALAGQWRGKPIVR